MTSGWFGGVICPVCPIQTRDITSSDRIRAGDGGRGDGGLRSAQSVRRGGGQDAELGRHLAPHTQRGIHIPRIAVQVGAHAYLACDYPTEDTLVCHPARP